MSFLSKFFKKNVFLGVDVGTASIKMVELKYDNGKILLSNYGSVVIRDVAMEAYAGPSVHRAIATLLERMDVKGGRVYVSLPGSNGLIALLEFPEMDEKELEQAIRFEAHKYIPADMEDVALSWEVVRKSENAKKNLLEKREKTEGIGNATANKQEVLLVGALKNDVNLLSSRFQKANHDIHAIEIESFSLVRSLASEIREEVLIVDMGHSICNFILARDGVIRISRNIDIGGKSITETIADSMKVSLSRAESIKRGGKNLFQEKGLSLTFSSLEVVLKEVSRIVSSYEKKHSGKKVSRIILSGGSASMKGIGEFFEKRTGIRTEVGDPWKKIVYDQALEPFIEEMGASFAVAIGLAMRGVEDFRRGE